MLGGSEFLLINFCNANTESELLKVARVVNLKLVFTD